MRIASQFTDSKIFIQFGGQGSDYFQEMYNLYKTRPELDRFFTTVFEAIDEELEQDFIKESGFLPAGIDLQAWLTSGDPPEKKYLQSGPVSLPLIGATQLANLFLLFEHGLSIRDIKHNIHGITGHSQGLLSAVFTALASEQEDLYLNVSKFIKYLLCLGVCCQQCYGVNEIDEVTENKRLHMGEKDISPMVAFVGPSASVLQEMVDELNKELSPEDIIYISLYNTSNSSVLSARPYSLLQFKERYREVISTNNWKYVFLKTSAPYHSPYLEKSLASIKAHLRRIDFSFAGKDLLVPVFSISDGRNLQHDGKLEIQLYREMVIQPQYWKNAISSMLNDTSVSYILDLGPGRTSTRLTGEYLKGSATAPEIFCVSIPNDLKKIIAA
jgi:malonyl CoA-acyl carrier protein transacylase